MVCLSKVFKVVGIGSKLATEPWFVITFGKFTAFDRGERAVLWDVFDKQFFKIVIKPLLYCR